MRKQSVWLFGNPDWQPDALPIQLKPVLEKLLPQYDFLIKDPNEEWDMPNKLIIIDTIIGLKKITSFTSLNDFSDHPRLTMHDFDLLTNLKWLAKLHRLPPFVIIGLPAKMDKKVAANKVASFL